jgi:hypothetical protein
MKCDVRASGKRRVALTFLGSEASTPAGQRKYKAECDCNAEWIAQSKNAYPALAAEIRTLRARVAGLEADSGWEAAGIRTAERDDWMNRCIDAEAERDRLRAERDAARDEAAGLRAALESINRLDENGNAVVKGWSEIDEIIRTALARTSDQHRARIEAARLREAEVRG